MKLVKMFIISLMALGLVGLTAGTSAAASLGINIEVFKNGVSQGTAIGGASTSTNVIFDVSAVAGDTLRFLVMLNAVPGGTMTAFGTNIMGVDANNSAGGLAEMRYVAGSAATFTGQNFAILGGNPNNSLNDTSPAVGNGNSASSAATTNGPNLYKVEYIVQAGVNADALRDFNVVLTGIPTSPGGSDTLSTGTDSASVRVNLSIPEPASLLLLGSGLAALVGYGRKKVRK